MTDFPFELDFDLVQMRLDELARSLISRIRAESISFHQCEPFAEYPVFQTGYEALKRATSGFQKWTAGEIACSIQRTPIVLFVLQSIHGWNLHDWASSATWCTGIRVSDDFLDSLACRIGLAPLKPLSKTGTTQQRIKALVEVASLMLTEGAPKLPMDKIHRLTKADSKGGLADLQAAGQIGVPYAMLLYERYLGRPFAGHKDSVSELIGENLEIRIEEALGAAGISFRKTKRAEKVAGFDQAPDFIVPDEFNPQVVIEAKIAEDDGTARDKVTRVQHLGHLSTQGQPEGSYRYEVIACIGGRGFGICREDMKKLLLATHGKVFTLKSLDRLIDCTQLRDFKTK